MSDKLILSANRRSAQSKLHEARELINYAKSIIINDSTIQHSNGYDDGDYLQSYLGCAADDCDQVIQTINDLEDVAAEKTVDELEEE